MAPPTNDDAWLAEIRQWARAMRAAYPDRDGMSLCQGMVEDLLRLLDEARADERWKLVAMLREPSDTAIDKVANLIVAGKFDNLSPCDDDARAILAVAADLLERTP